MYLFQNGHNAVTISVAEHYIEAFGKLAKEGNTVLLPTNTGDVTNMVAQVGGAFVCRKSPWRH